MRGPLELIADLYDYQWQYYSNYIQRRIIFTEITPDSVIKKTINYNIFRNKDYDNIDKLVSKSGLLGLSLGKCLKYYFSLNFFILVFKICLFAF